MADAIYPMKKLNVCKNHVNSSMIFTYTYILHHISINEQINKYGLIFTLLIF